MTIFDIFAIIFIISLIGYGLSGGVINLLLRVFSWYGAMIMTILIYPTVKEIVLGFINNNTLVGYITLIACAGIFATATYFITEPMLENRTAPNQLEKIIGAGVGLALAVLLLGTSHFVMLQVNSEVVPSWMSKSKMLPVIKQSSDIQAKFLEENVNKILYDLGIK